MSADKPNKPIDRTPPPSANESMQTEVQSQQQSIGVRKTIDPMQLLHAPVQSVIPSDVGGTQNQPSSATNVSRSGEIKSAAATAPEQTRVASQPVPDRLSGGIAPKNSIEARPSIGPSRGLPPVVTETQPDDRRPADLRTRTVPIANDVTPFVAPSNRPGEIITNPGTNSIVKANDTGVVRSSVDSESSPASTRAAVFPITVSDSGLVSVARQPQKAPDTVPAAPSGTLERPLPNLNTMQDSGLPKPFVAPEVQPRTNLSSEQSGGQNQTRSAAPDRLDPAVTAKGNTGATLEVANISRPYASSLESQNQPKPVISSDAQIRPAAGVSPDSGNRELSSHDGLIRTASGGSVFDSQGRQQPVGAEKLPASSEKSLVGLENRQAPSDVSNARGAGPQSVTEVPTKPGLGNTTNEFGTRREAGVQLPDTKQTTGRTDSGVQLPDTKQSSGRTDTGGTRMPETRNDTGRNDASTGKLPDAKTLANLDQKFGDKLNPPGKGGGIPIPVPGIPDILGGLRGDKDGKTGKDAKADSPGPKEGSVRNEVSGGRDTRDGKGAAQGSKDSKIADGRGDTKSGADDKSAAGQKGVRSESDAPTKGSDGKSVQDVRTANQDGKTGTDGKSVDGRTQGGSNLVHDGGTKSDAGGNKSLGDNKGISDKGLGDKGLGEKGLGENKGQSDKGLGDKGLGDNKGVGDKVPGEKGTASDRGFGDGKTRADQPGTRVDQGGVRVDADGKPIGGRAETGGAIKAEIGDKGHTDVGAGGKPVGSRGDAPFVLPPGSLPVPDLVGGIKNVGQQIDGRIGKPLSADDKGLRQPDKGDAVKPDAKGTVGDGVKTVVTGGVAGADGVKTAITGGAKVGDEVKTAMTGDAKVGDGVKTAITGGAKVGDGVKNAGASETSADGKQVAGKNPLGTKADGAIIVPPSAVPLTEMIGNLKGIAARIFPPESRTGRPDAFDDSLPGRKTERLEDRTQSTLGAGVRAESTIPIIRAIGERVGKGDEQFVIRVPQSALDANKAPQSKVETGVPTPPWIAPEHAVSNKAIPGVKAVDANAAKSTDTKSVKSEVQSIASKAGDHQVPLVNKHDQVLHDEVAERVLVNLELVGSVESAPATESDEEEVFPLAALEYFGGEFEKTISDEEDVMFDGDGNVADDDEQSTRYQYIVEAGDTVELIAIKVFKNVTLAPLIYEINKDAIPIGMQDGRMVFTLKVGTVIWLPFPKEVKAYMQT